MYISKVTYLCLHIDLVLSIVEPVSVNSGIYECQRRILCLQTRLYYKDVVFANDHQEQRHVNAKT